MSSDTARLRWQCRRGMLELELLLLGYLDQAYPHSNHQEQSAFRDFLCLSDDDLSALLLNDNASPSLRSSWQVVISKVQGCGAS